MSKTHKEYPINAKDFQEALILFREVWEKEIIKHNLQNASRDERDKVRPTRDRNYRKVAEYILQIISIVQNKPNFNGYPEDTKEIMRDMSLAYCIRAIRTYDINKNPVSYFFTVAYQAHVQAINEYHNKKRLDTIAFDERIAYE